MGRIIFTRLFVSIHQKSVTTWPILPCRPTNRQRPTIERINESRCESPNPPKRSDEGVREAVAGEVSQERAGLHWPQILASVREPDRRVLATSLQPLLHFRPPPWLLPQTFAVAKNIAVREETLQYTLRLSSPLSTYTWTAAQDCYAFWDKDVIWPDASEMAMLHGT